MCKEVWRNSQVVKPCNQGPGLLWSFSPVIFVSPPLRCGVSAVVVDSASAFLAAEGQVQSKTLLLAGFLYRLVRQRRPSLGSLTVMRWPHACTHSSRLGTEEPAPWLQSLLPRKQERLGLAWLSSELNCALCITGHRKKEHLKLPLVWLFLQAAPYSLYYNVKSQISACDHRFTGKISY